MPFPHKGQKKEEFLAICMNSEEEKKTFPDSKQRYAVCQSKWAKHIKKSTSEWIASSLDVTLPEEPKQE